MVAAGSPGNSGVDARVFFLVLGFSAIAWFAFCCSLSWIRWESRALGIDTAVWCQLMHLHNSGGPWEYTGYVDMVGTSPRLIWGTHFNLTLPALSWLFRLWSHPLLLSVVQHAAHAVGAVLIGFLAWQTADKDEVVGLCAMIAFLLYPPLARAQIGFDYSSRHFAALLLPLAVLTFRLGRHGWTMAALLTLTAGIENLGLLAGFLCFAFARQQRAQRAFYLIAGLLFCAYPFLVIRYGLGLFRPDAVPGVMMQRYDHLLTGPGEALQSLLRWENGVYLLSLFVPLAFLPLVFPSTWWLATIPFLAQNALSHGGETRLIGHHYTSPLAVALFLCVLPAFSHPRRRALAMLLTVACLVGGHLVSPVLPQIDTLLRSPTETLGHLFSPVEAAIPAHASLSVPHIFAPRFFARRHLWFFPQGWQEAEYVIVPGLPLTFPVVSASEIAAIRQHLRQEPGVRILFDHDLFLVVHRSTSPAPGDAP